ELGVFGRTAGIAFALIPNDALDPVADGGIEHAVEDVARTGVAAHPGLRVRRRTGNRSAFGARRGGVLLPFRQGGFVSGLRLAGVPVLFPLYRAIHEPLETRIIFQRLTAHPGFGRGTAPGVVDQANRNADDLVNIASEEKTDGAETERGFRPGNLPFSFEIV